MQRDARSLAQAAGMASGVGMVPLVTAAARVTEGLGSESMLAAVVSGLISGFLTWTVVSGLLDRTVPGDQRAPLDAHPALVPQPARTTVRMSRPARPSR